MSKSDITQKKIWDLRYGPLPSDFKGLQFRYLEIDKIGTSGNYWGYVSEADSNLDKIRPQVARAFGPTIGERAALLKYNDYDYSDISVNEWLYGEIAKLLLHEVRVPEIQRVSLKGEPGLLSYSLLPKNHVEELFHMEDIISLKFGDINSQKFYRSFGIKDIIECVGDFISDKKNSEIVTSGIINTTILDCITNNVDRHGRNWGLIRNIENGWFDLFVVDHSLAFINMIDTRPGVVDPSGYTNSVVASFSSKRAPESAKKVLEYIQSNFPNEFTIMGNRISEHLGEIEGLCKTAEKELGGFRHFYTTILGRCNKVLENQYSEKGEMTH